MPDEARAECAGVPLPVIFLLLFGSRGVVLRKYIGANVERAAIDNGPSRALFV